MDGKEMLRDLEEASKENEIMSPSSPPLVSPSLSASADPLDPKTDMDPVDETIGPGPRGEAGGCQLGEEHLIGLVIVGDLVGEVGPA